MDEGRIVLVGNETDILHSGYSHTISHDNKRYTFVHFNVLSPEYFLDIILHKVHIDFSRK